MSNIRSRCNRYRAILGLTRTPGDGVKQDKTRTYFGEVSALPTFNVALHAPIIVEGSATYMVVRYYSSGAKPLVMVRGLSSDDARLMVQDREASSLTCKRRENRWHTRDNGAWYDAWIVDDGSEPRAPKIVRRKGRIVTPMQAASMARRREERIALKTAQ